MRRWVRGEERHESVGDICVVTVENTRDEATDGMLKLAHGGEGQLSKLGPFF